MGFRDTKYTWLEERTILLTETGSYAYGTNTPNSDKDYIGVCIPPMEYYLGVESFGGYDGRNGKNFRNTKDDVDVTILHLNKFVKGLMDGVPNYLETLFIEKDKYVKLTELGYVLVKNRHLFLTKRVKNKFGGFARSQGKRMLKSNRKELIEQFGYDTKMFTHSVRLYESASEILKTGDYRTFRENNKFLKECRNGKYELEEALKLLNELEECLQRDFKNSNLPDNVDKDKVNNLLVEINKRGLFG